MAQHQVSMISGGSAQWGRQLPLRGRLKTVCFEADLMTKIVLSDGAPTYFRTVFAGMDEVDTDGSTPHGYGTVWMQDPHTDDLLLGRVDWFMENGRDKGQFTFDDGTGRWKGVAGDVAVDLEFCSATSAGSLTSGDPVLGLAFVEGAGQFRLPD